MKVLSHRISAHHQYACTCVVPYRISKGVCTVCLMRCRNHACSSPRVMAVEIDAGSSVFICFILSFWNHYVDVGQPFAAVISVLAEVAGRKLKRLIRITSDDIHDMLHAMIALNKEGLRCITYYFMTISNAVEDYSKFPALMDIVWPKASVIYTVHQYYSTLLAGRCSRLILVWAMGIVIACVFHNGPQLKSICGSFNFFAIGLELGLQLSAQGAIAATFSAQVDFHSRVINSQSIFSSLSVLTV